MDKDARLTGEQLGNFLEFAQDGQVIVGAHRLPLPRYDPVLQKMVELPHEKRHIETSVNMPLSRLADGLSTLAAEGGIVVHCTSGYRSAIAASVMRRGGISSVSDLVGGLDAWETAELATAP